MAACERPAAITGPTIPAGGEFLASVSDGAHDGNPHFFFLPPIARHEGDFTGVFDGSLDPVVDICRLDGTECAAPVGHFSATPRRGGGESERMRGGEYYLGNWRTNRSHVDPKSLYRICVSVGPSALGHADVDGEGLVGRRKHGGRGDGREHTVPVKFRIEEGALDPGAFVDAECTGALRPRLPTQGATIPSPTCDPAPTRCAREQRKGSSKSSRALVPRVPVERSAITSS